MGNVTPFFNWSFSYTESPPVTLRLVYQPEATPGSPKPSEKTVDLASTDVSMTLSSYEAFTYETGTTDDEGRPQTETTEVLAKKEEIKRTTQASVAQSYVVDRLSRGVGLPSGDAITRTVTEYQYLATTDGPFLYKEISETYITMAELAGGLDIPTYKYYDPGVALFLSTVKEIAYEKKIEWANKTERNSDLGVENTYSYKRESTKTETSTWIANGLRDFGKQGFAEAMKQLESIAFDPARSNELIGTMVEYMTELIFEGTEIQVEIGKGEYGFESRRDEPEIDKEPESDPGDSSNYDPDDPYDPIDPPINDNPRPLRNDRATSTGTSGTTGTTGKKCFKGIIQFQNVQYNSADSTQTANYEMPFAPDDYLFLDGNKRKLVRNNARLAAEEYAITESLMDIGHAFGQNIVTGFGDIPTLELSPVYVRLADVEGAFLLDALSYAWDSNGLVVSSDLMLIGVTGYYGSTPPATSWLRLPVSSLGLPAAGNPIIGTGSKANSIAIPTGFNPLNLTPVLAALPSNGVDTYAVKHNTATIIGPVLKREQYYIGVRIGTATIDYSYALFLFEEYVTQIRVGVTYSETYLILVPGANGYSITANPPIFITGTAVAVPATVVTVAPEVPTIDKFTTVNVPASVVYVAAIAPDKAGDASLIVTVPLTTIQVAAVAPDRAGEDAVKVLVPAAVVDVAAIAPQVEIQTAGVSVPTAGAIVVVGLVPEINPPADPYFSSVSMLLPFDGANGSTVFTDYSPTPATLTRYGNTSISTAQSKYGGASLYLDGSGDYLQVTSPSTNLTNWWSTNYTIECFVYVSAFTQRPFGQSSVLVGHMTPTTGVQNWSFGPRNDGKIVFFYWNGGEVRLESSSTVALNTWVHIAFTNSSGNLRIFIDGVQSALGTISGNPGSDGAEFSIGACQNAFFNGYIDELRITKGVARYTANFTPPTGPHPTQGPSTIVDVPSTAVSVGALVPVINPAGDPTFSANSLLIPFDGTVGSNAAPLDRSNNALTLTVGGSAPGFTISDTQFKYGQAGHFNGSARIEVPATSLLSFPGDFELQMWFYMLSRSSYSTILELGAYTNGIMIRHGSADPGVWINGGQIGGSGTTLNVLSLNAWHHIALSRIGTAFKVYINGTQAHEVQVSGTINGTVGATFIGDSTHAATRFFEGYIDDFRIKKGLSTITGNFTPTGPHPLAGTPDPYFASTSLLLPLDGANNSTTFTDFSSNNLAMTRHGNAVITTTNPKYGTGSLLLQTTGDYISTPASSAFAFGTGDFTVECHCLFTSATNNGLFAFANGLALSVFSGQWWLSDYGSGGTPMGAHMAANTWVFVRVTRSGTQLKLFIDGVQIGSTLTNATNFTQNECWVGMYFSAAYTWLGKIDNFRVTKGVARTDAPPTGPHPIYGPSTIVDVPSTAVSVQGWTPKINPDPLSASTSLLLPLDSSFADFSGNNFTPSIIGTGVSISTTTIKYGAGAAYFNNAGYVSYGQQNALLFDGDFTIECWVRLDALNQNHTIGSSSNSSNTQIFRYGFGGNNLVTCYINDQFVVNAANAGTQAQVWQHLALCRSGSNTRFFADGVQVGATYTSNFGTFRMDVIGATLWIGGVTQYLKGHIDDLRLTKAARYTANFTPTGPHPLS